MVTTRRPRFYSSLKQIMELVFFKKKSPHGESGVRGFCRVYLA
jgi:hypothetical protein